MPPPDDPDHVPDWSAYPPPPPAPPPPPPPVPPSGWGGPSRPPLQSRGEPETPWGPAGSWLRRVAATVVDSLTLLIPNFVITGVSNGALGSALSLAISATYATVLISRNGQTVGNRAASTRVVDAVTGEPVPALRAFGRWACYASLQLGLLLTLLYAPAVALLFAVVYLVDLLWPLWDARNQTLHDKIVGTLVVRTFQ